MKKAALCITIVYLILPALLFAQTWSEAMLKKCPFDSRYCCSYTRGVKYDTRTCELTVFGEQLNRAIDISWCKGPSYNNWMPQIPNYSFYPKDALGNPLPHIGGCNSSTAYYECSPYYDDADDFSGQFSEMSQWWYFTSTGSDGNTYKCMSAYKDHNGTTVNYRTSGYHLTDPASSSDCLNEKAFNALNKTVCGQQPAAFNTGIYTTFNDPDSTYKCVDSNGDGSDDSTGVGCIVTALPRPDGKLGDPDNKESNSCGAPSWKVNMVNMNIFMSDIPMWYRPTIGPSVNIQLSYNSQSSTARNKPFGNKWSMNYGSYLNIDAYGNINVSMPDGRKDVYKSDGLSEYIRPLGVYNTLHKISALTYELEMPDGSVYVYNMPSPADSSQILLGEIWDAYGQKLLFNYNNSGQLKTITDALGKTTTLIYNSDGFAERIDDPFGRSCHFVYDANGSLSGITDMGGYRTELSYTTGSYLRSLKNDNGTWEFYIEPSDGMISNIAPYPAPGQPMGENFRITITNPMGGKEEYFYQGDYSWHVSPGDYISYTSPDINNFKNAQKTYYYIDRSIPEGRTGKIQTPEGGDVTVEKYDNATGKPAIVTDYHGVYPSGAAITHRSQFNYNANGLVTSVTDIKGSVTTINYYPNNIDVLSIVNVLGLISFSYNSSHDVTSMTDRLMNLTSFTYNPYGQVASVTKTQGTAVQKATEFFYSPDTHDLIEIGNAGNTLMTFTHDSVGRVRTATDAAGTTITYDYDNLDRPTKITYPDGKFETITYSSCCPHLIDSKTDRTGFVTKYTYDKLKQLIKIQGREGIIQYEYDLNGNLKKLTDAAANQTSFEYDHDNRLVKSIRPDGKFTTYSYDKAGLLTKTVNSRGISKDLLYDENHDLTGIDYSDLTPDVTFTYDNSNRVQARADGTGSYQYSYDGNNRLTAIDGPKDNDVIAFEYNELGELKKLIPQAGQMTKYDHDPIGRLTGIGSGTKNFTYGYTGTNSLVQSLSGPDGSITEYSYNDPLKRLTETINKNARQEMTGRYEFAYGEHDLVETETITEGITPATQHAGTTTYSHNNLNQITSSAGPDRTYLYDDDGNMVRGYNPDGFVMNMVYDAENRLKLAQYTDDNNVIHRIEYSYDGESLLAEVKKYEDNVLKGATRFVRVGNLVLQELDENDQVIREYTWGPDMGGGIGGLLALKQNGLDYTYQYDGKGNVTALLDSSQNIAAQYRYDEFGNLVSKAGTLDQPYRFSTKQYDEETGLYYYGYRFYSPSIGRWLTRDPLGESGGMNLYGFVGNDPVNMVDPMGLWREDVHSGIGNSAYGTYKWARELGISDEEARIVANANNAVDAGSWTNWLPLIGDQSRHFNQPYLHPNKINETRDYWADIELHRAAEYFKQGDCNAAWGHLGKGLHSIQDKYAHRDWNTGFFGADSHPMWYDNWNDPRNKNTSSATEIATKIYINNFLQLRR